MNAPDTMIHIETTDRLLNAAAKGYKLDVVRAAMGELEALCHHKIAAAEAFSDACKRIGGNANMSPSALSAYVGAIVRDKRQKNAEKAEQLSRLFEEMA